MTAAAASLRFVMTDLAAAFGHRTGCKLRLSFGASGTIARQIRQGAPYEIFLSADAAYAESLVSDGLTQGGGQDYALGRLAVFAPKGAPFAADPHLRGLGRALDQRRIMRFAIANPAHAPYGRAAKQALARAGLWDRIRPHLVFGENVAQAARFAASGAADGGLTAYALLKSPAFTAQGTRALIDAGMHAPLRHRLVLLKGAGQGARHLARFMMSAEAQAILKKFGFDVPNS